MVSKRYQQPTEFKVEFWTRASGTDRKHRHRYYAAVEGMLRAGARWEAKGSDYWCRYWNGLNTWITAARETLPGKPAFYKPPGYKSPGQGINRERVTDLVQERIRRGNRPSQVFSVFHQCEAVAAEIMLKDGRATLKIPIEDIPESVLYNELGEKALFAVMIPGDQVHTFNELCKDIRA